MEPMMADTDFKYLRMSTIGDIVLVEFICNDVQGPDMAKAFIAELIAVVDQDPPSPLLVDLSRTCYFSSMGYSALFKMVKRAKERGRPIRFCSMHADVSPGAEIVGLHLVVAIHDCRKSALEAFAESGESPAGKPTDFESASAVGS